MSRYRPTHFKNGRVGFRKGPYMKIQKFGAKNNFRITDHGNRVTPHSLMWNGKRKGLSRSSHKRSGVLSGNGSGTYYQSTNPWIPANKARFKHKGVGYSSYKINKKAYHGRALTARQRNQRRMAARAPRRRRR